MFVLSVSEILSVLLISLFVGNFINTLFFLTAFIPLKMYAGGYHSETRIRCYLVLLLVYILFSIVSETILPNKYYLFVLLFSLSTAVIVWKFAPIVSANKNVSIKEKTVYKKIAKIIVLLEITIVMFAILIFPESKCILSFSLGGFSVSVSMVVALVKDKYKKGGETNEKT